MQAISLGAVIDHDQSKGSLVAFASVYIHKSVLVLRSPWTFFRTDTGRQHE